jgi:hypothetical protein
MSPGRERVLGRGAVGATAGTGLGFTGTAVIHAIAPRLTGSVATPTGTRILRLGRPVTTVVASQTAAVPMSVQVSPLRGRCRRDPGAHRRTAGGIVRQLAHRPAAVGRGAGQGRLIPEAATRCAGKRRAEYM